MSSHEIGTPSLQTARGLIVTWTVSGLSPVFVMSARFLSTWTTPLPSKYTNDGITWLVTHWFATVFSADVPWLYPLKSPGRAIVTVPPLAGTGIVGAPAAAVVPAPPPALVLP